MKNSSIKKINTAGLIGYIISIILIVCTITAMVFIGICTAGAISIAKEDINVKTATNININSKGNFLSKLNSFISIDGVEDLNILVDENNSKINDSDLSKISIEEKDGGIIINAKTNEITLSMKKITIALISAFIYLGAITVSLHMVKALMKSLKNCETPFSEKIIKNMTNFATSLVCVIVLNIITKGFLSSLTRGSGYNLSINLGSILLVAVIYILVIIFKYGAKLQQESDETL